MAITKVSVSVIPSTSVPANTSKASPGLTSTPVDCGSYYNAVVGYRILNGSSAPGAACIVVFQISGDSSIWYDLYTVAGDIAISSVNSGTVDLPKGTKYLRAIVYGHTTNPVTVDASLQAVTGL